MPFAETLRLESVSQIDPQFLVQLGEQLRHRGIELRLVDLESCALETCKNLILEHGSTYILSIRRLQEAVLPKVQPEDRRDLLLRILSAYLKSLFPSRSLLVIDAHFFPQERGDTASYATTVMDVLAPIIPKIATIRFITEPKFNSTLYESIKRRIVHLNPQLDVRCTTTSDFHDRFWIADETKGLFVGTSLNGVGVRYALTDYMRDEDTAYIVGELRRLRLL